MGRSGGNRGNLYFGYNGILIMAELKYKSIIPNDKPRWLKIIQTWVDKQYNGLIVQNNKSNFDALKFFIDTAIVSLKENKTITRSEVTTEIRTDEGKTVLFIKRNGMMLQTYYIE